MNPTAVADISHPVHTVRRATVVLALVLVAAFGVSGCGDDHQDDALGGELSDKDVQKACLVLERNDWDQDYALADAASSLELGTVQHLNAMYSAMGSDVIEYCEAKLAES